jgi:uncharacterized protein with GYD domain
MPHYIILWNWTDQGIRNVKEAPKRADAFRDDMENAGGKVTNIYLSAGKYDGLIIAEAPSDEVMMSRMLSLGSKGNVRTVTLKAFPMNEAAKVIDKLS